MTDCVCDDNILRQEPFVVAQILTSLSFDELTSLLSVFALIRGSHARDVTNFLCPFSGLPIYWPESAFQMRMLLSMPALAKVLLSGENATKSTHPLCPSQVTKGHSVFRSHILTVVSPEAEASFYPFGEKATLNTASL